MAASQLTAPREFEGHGGSAVPACGAEQEEGLCPSSPLSVGLFPVTSGVSVRRAEVTPCKVDCAKKPK